MNPSFVHLHNHSDFSLIEMLERRPNSFARDPAAVAPHSAGTDMGAAC